MSIASYTTGQRIAVLPSAHRRLHWDTRAEAGKVSASLLKTGARCTDVCTAKGESPQLCLPEAATTRQKLAWDPPACQYLELEIVKCYLVVTARFIFFSFSFLFFCLSLAFPVIEAILRARARRRTAMRSAVAPSHHAGPCLLVIGGIETISPPIGGPSCFATRKIPLGRASGEPLPDTAGTSTGELREIAFAGCGDAGPTAEDGACREKASKETRKQQATRKWSRCFPR